MIHTHKFDAELRETPSIKLRWYGSALNLSHDSPAIKKQWIPGCMVEAIVKSRSNHSCSNYTDFSNSARQAEISVLVEQVRNT